MKRLFIYILISSAFSTVTFGQKYSIKITVEDFSDSVAFLGYHFADKRFVQDTVPVDNNHTVIFTANTPYKPGLYFFYTPNVYFEFIVNEPEIVLQTKGEDYVANMQVIKSEENRIFKEMQLYVTGKRKTYNKLAARADSLKEDSLALNQIRKKLQDIDVDVKDYQNALIIRYPDTFVARMVAAMQKPDIPDSMIGNDTEKSQMRYHYYKNHYFDGVDLADAGLLRTPIFDQKIVEFLDKVIIQNPDSIIQEINFLLNAAEENDEVYRYMLVTLTNKYETSPIMGMDEVFVYIVEQYYLTGTADWVDADMLKKLSERIATIKPNFIGNQAPPLVLNDTLLTTVSLYDIHADYTILYFYDPDCGHCKKKTPVLYEAYGNLRNKNIEVLAINITTNTERWKEYITENEFDWINLMDSFNRSDFRYYYDVRTTPTLYILDKEKKIIAKKLDTSQVEEFINARMEFEKEQVSKDKSD